MVLWWFIYIILLYIRDGLVSYPYRFNWGISESMNGESRFSTNLCMFSGFEHCSIAMTRYSIMFFDRGTILSFDRPKFENMINDNLKEFEYDEWFSYVFEFFLVSQTFRANVLGLTAYLWPPSLIKPAAPELERERETAHGQCTVYPLVN